jgi:vacuolar-type H+-ATPase subunit I/STV1
MQSIELTKPITTESLLSEFESRFNQTMDVSKFTKEELEDYANKIRTKIHEITQNTHFGQELKDDNYQKSQMMLDIVNQAIKEYGGSGNMSIIDKAKSDIKDKLSKGQPVTPADRKAAAASMKTENPLAAMGMAAARSAGAAAGTAVVDKIADKLGASKDNKGKMIKKEGVEEQSELILAAKDMMDKVTGYLEDLATMKTEGMLELADRIRDEMGADKADAFMQKIQPAIEQAEATLTTTRQELDNGVRILTGEETASEPMGADDTMNMDTDLDSLDSDAGEEDDEFGASDAEAGGTEPEGREQRESREVFETSNRIYGKLAGK